MNMAACVQTDLSKQISKKDVINTVPIPWEKEMRMRRGRYDLNPLIVEPSNLSYLS